MSTWDWTLVEPGMPERPILDLQAITNRSLTVRLDDGSNASFAINGRHPDARAIEELATDLVVKRNGLKLSRGRIGPSSDNVDETSHTVQFSAWDYRELLNRRLLQSDDTLSFIGVEQTNIGWSLVNASQDRTSGALGITASTLVGTTGVVRTLTLTAGMKCGEQVKLLGEMDNGFEWDIDPDLVFTPYYPLRGNQSSGYLLDLGGSVTGFQRNVDPADFANVLRLSGNGSGTFTAADIAEGSAGRWETNIGNLDWSQATVNAKGPWMLTKMGLLPSYVVTVDPAHWSGPGDLWVGDKPRLQLRSGRLDVDTAELRVTEMRFTVNDDDAEKIEVVLGYAPANRDQKVHNVLSRLDMLERR